MNSHNTFDKPYEVTPQIFASARLTSGGLEILAPKMSVVALEVA
jgi:alpha-L-arabinofuranosidase